MGLVESTLKPQTVKCLVRHDSLTPLPSFTLETAKFTDGTSGFVVTMVDLAKNTVVRTMSVKFVFSPAENSLVYIGNDDTNISFVKDRLTGKVVCSASLGSIVRFCVNAYDPLDDPLIDKIGELFKPLQTLS
jgi:hypothetical protein